MNGWKWDAQHIVLIVAYTLGLAIGVWGMLPLLKAETATQVVVSLTTLAIVAVTSFLKQTPKDAGAAFAAGEAIAAINGTQDPPKDGAS